MPLSELFLYDQRNCLKISRIKKKRKKKKEGAWNVHRYFFYSFLPLCVSPSSSHTSSSSPETFEAPLIQVPCASDEETPRRAPPLAISLARSGLLSEHVGCKILSAARESKGTLRLSNGYAASALHPPPSALHPSPRSSAHFHSVTIRIWNFTFMQSAANFRVPPCGTSKLANLLFGATSWLNFLAHRI